MLKMVKQYMKKWFVVFKTRRHGFSMKYGMSITEWGLQNIIIDIHPILFCKQHKEDSFKFSSDFNKITRKNSKRKKMEFFMMRLSCCFMTKFLKILKLQIPLLNGNFLKN